MSSQKLKIAAIIPLYNGAKFIREALASVLTQTTPPDEIIVVDDGSTDCGAAIVEGFMRDHTHIKLLRKQNGGQSSARNLGVRHSTGQLIALLDQDDAWYPHHLERLVQPFLEMRNIPLGWVYSNLDEIDVHGLMSRRNTLNNIKMVQHPKMDIIECLRSDMFVLPSASLISRDAFNIVGGFDEELSGYEDDDLFLRIFRAGFDNVYIDESLTKWRIFAESASFSDRMGRSRVYYFRKLVTAFPDQKERELFFSRDLIAPRFLPWILRDYTRALRERDVRKISITLDYLEIVGKYHRPRVRFLISLLMPFMRSPILMRPFLSVEHIIRPALRRLLH